MLGSYHPTALLSVLDKDLECTMAKRIAWIAFREKVLPRQQFGVLCCGSVVDLTNCFTHDVERALNEGNTASMLTLDIRGAFDAVFFGRFIRHLREQGWTNKPVNRDIAFQTNRTAKMRLDCKTDPY